MFHKKNVCISLIIFFQICCSYCLECNIPENVDNLPQDHQIISYLTDPCRYDKYKIPNDNSTLNIDIAINGTHLDATQSEFTLYLLTKLTYLAASLNFQNISSKPIIHGDEYLIEKIWTPNIKIADGDYINVLEMTQKDSSVSIASNGFVTLKYKMMAKFNCWLNLQKFPFDSQTCRLTFGDWFYNKESLQLNWNQSSLDAKLHFSEYIIDSIDLTKVHDSHISQLNFEFKFHRDSGYYLLDFYIPSFLLVCTAWVTFWLQADAGPPRATLGCSTVIAFITLQLGVSKDIPKVSYVKASDIWFLAVILFIFLSLAEFAFVNVIWRRKKTIELKKVSHKYIIKSAVMPRKAREDLKRYQSTQTINVIDQSYDNLGFTKQLNNGIDTTVDLSQESINNDQSDQMFNWTTMTPKEVAIYVDRKARFVFPIAFFIFNLIYWLFVNYY